MKAVFDTNILIDYLIGNLLAKKEIEQYQSPQISIITKMEILVGVTDNEEIIKEFLNGFNIIPLNDEIAEIAVNIRKENKIKIPDAIIWATAKYTSLSYSLCKLQKDIVENTIKKQLKYRGKNG